jgi:hypothetical protein
LHGSEGAVFLRNGPFVTQDYGDAAILDPLLNIDDQRDQSQ